MCTLCIITHTFDPARHTAGTGDVFADFNEIADAPADVTTAYSIAPGDAFIGEIDSSGDEDWVAITLEAGTTYVIDLMGTTSGVGTLGDPLVQIYDAGGILLDDDDDSGAGLESQLVFTATTTGTHYIGAGAFGVNTGTYRLEVSEITPPPPPTPPGTLDDLATYLTDGYWSDAGGSRHSFDTSASNRITVNIAALTGDGQQLALWAFEAWEMVADIEFVLTTGSADITFDDDWPGAFAGYSASRGTTISANVNVSTNWLDTSGTTIDSYSFQTYVHEIGHALGLGHQGNYNNVATYGTDETFGNDSWQVSVMSYFSQTQNTTTNASYGLLLTAMMADIVAIQDLYGAAGAGSATAGDTTWGGANSTLGNYLDEVFTAAATGTPSANYNGSAMAVTIYDAGGIDTVDLSDVTVDSRLDLRPEQFSDIGGAIGNLGIARGTILERAVMGTGNDTVQGNSADNHIQGRDGDDVLFGDIGEDTLVGGDGDDDIRGGTNADVIYGNDGNDTLRGESGGDVISGGTGDDVISGGTGHDDLNGGTGNDRMFGGNNNDTLRGGDGNDDMSGDRGHDVLAGNNGDDTLRGGDGNDRMFGGTGNDVLAGNDGNDNMEGDAGLDRMFGGAGDDTLRGGDGNDNLEGDNGDDVLVGNDHDDTLRGGNGNDRMFGGTGDDRLIGDAGRDEMHGGLGADVFVFNAVSDSPHGAGRDTISDFKTGIDRIDLSGFGGLTFVSAYTGAGNQVRYNDAIGRLYIDTDGDSLSDFSVDLGAGAGLIQADLIL